MTAVSPSGPAFPCTFLRQSVASIVPWPPAPAAVCTGMSAFRLTELPTFPNEKCMDANGVSRPGVAVSADNGLTWVVRTVPDAQSISPGSDPSIAAGANNTIYLGYVNVDGHAKIAVSQDRGLHWSKSKDAGTPR